MILTTLVCDLCKKPIVTACVNAIGFEHSGVQLQIQLITPRKDICHDCAKEVIVYGKPL